MDKMNVLVCDDDKAIVDALEIYLKQENYGVIKAYNGVQALKALNGHIIHLVLLGSFKSGEIDKGTTHQCLFKSDYFNVQFVAIQSRY
ncbi:MAG: hypothetical protein ACM3TR_08500 [Caulobacteraceae bacterium]